MRDMCGNYITFNNTYNKTMFTHVHTFMSTTTQAAAEKLLQPVNKEFKKTHSGIAVYTFSYSQKIYFGSKNQEK